MSGPADGRRGQPVVLPQAALHWDHVYASGERPWGDTPSELARLVVARLRRPSCGASASQPPLRLLDVGCGYGRDSRYLANELGCSVVGIDPSPAAVRAARTARTHAPRVEYVAGDAASFARLEDQQQGFDVIFSCNVYQLLGPMGRREFVAALAHLARPGALLFLSTLSPRDPQHYAVGRQVSGEQRSWIHEIYLHFCTAEELIRDFDVFDVLDLEERCYTEKRARGVDHRHASWFLEGRRR